MASIKKVPRGWRARWRSPEGQSRSKTFIQKVDAERHLTSIEHSKGMGAYVDPSAGRVSFRDYAETWRRTQVHRPGTAVSVEQHLRLHVYPVLGGRAMAAIRPSEVQALVKQLSSALAPSTIAGVYGRVAAVFRSAVRDRVIMTSPCVDIRLPIAGARAVGEVLTSDQVLALADAVAPRYQGLIVTAAGLGLRPGELFGLTVDRIEVLRRAVRVNQQLVRIRGTGVALGPLKTPASYRTLALPDVVSEALSAHLVS